MDGHNSSADQPQPDVRTNHNIKHNFWLKIAIIVTSVIFLAGIIFLILKLTIWKAPDLYSEETTREEWLSTVTAIKAEAQDIDSDSAMEEFYQSKLSEISDKIKYQDVYLNYIREIASRGFTVRSRKMLSEIDVNELTCSQEFYFYSAYRHSYRIDQNDSQEAYYLDKMNTVSNRCNVEEPTL